MKGNGRMCGGDVCWAIAYTRSATCYSFVTYTLVMCCLSWDLFAFAFRIYDIVLCPAGLENGDITRGNKLTMYR